VTTLARFLLITVPYFFFFYRFAPLLTSAQLSLLSPESHIVPLTEVVGLGQKMLKVSLDKVFFTNGYRYRRSHKGRIRNGVLFD
jgi:hypothetical protein